MYSRQIVTYQYRYTSSGRFGTTFVQRAIDDMKNISCKCYTCGALTETTVTCDKHIIINTSIFIDKTYIQQNMKHSLISIAKTVTLNNIPGV